MATVATAVLAVVYFVGPHGLGVVAGVLIAVVLPLVLAMFVGGKVQQWRLEVYVAVALAGWAAFETTVGLVAWLCHLGISGASMGIPNLAADFVLLLAAARRGSFFVRFRGGVRSPKRHRGRLALAACLALSLLFFAIVLSLASETRSYEHGNTMSISALRANGRAPTVMVTNPTSTNRSVQVRVSTAGRAPVTYSRVVPARGQITIAPFSSTLAEFTATLYADGRPLSSVAITTERQR